MTFANSVPDRVTVSQMQEDDKAHKDLEALPSPVQLSVFGTQLSTHVPQWDRSTPTWSCFFGQEKDSSVYVTASTMSGSSSHSRCQPMPDVAFHMDNILHEGGSKEHTRRGLRCGGTTDPRGVLIRWHYIHWSVRMRTIYCRWPCPGHCVDLTSPVPLGLGTKADPLYIPNSSSRPRHSI